MADTPTLWESTERAGADAAVRSRRQTIQGRLQSRQVISTLLDPLDFVATDPAAARAAGAARLERHRSGRRLGLGEAIIAAVARGMDATIVTRNRPDFERQGASVLGY